MTLQEARVACPGWQGFGGLKCFFLRFKRIVGPCDALWGRGLKDNKKTPFNETGKRSVEGSWNYFRNSPSHF